MRPRKLLTLLTALVVASVGLTELTGSASAAVFKPSPPVVTPVAVPAGADPLERAFRISAARGEAGFSLVSYEYQVTQDPSNADPRYFEYFQFKVLPSEAVVRVGLIPAWKANYFRANMTVTLSDGSNFTTSWSDWLPDWGSVVAPPPPTVAPRTVVLGDSFSSGEGVPPFDIGTDGKLNKCHRSADAYAHQLVRASAISLQNFVACSGATVGNVLGRQQYPGQPAQVNALSKDTQLVILTIGGNDIGFTQLAEGCIAFRCQSLAPVVGQEIIALERISLPALFRQIKARIGPSTKVMLLGYPQELPDPAIVDASNCREIGLTKNLRIDKDGILLLRDTVNRLDLALKRAADKAGVTYVSPDGTFAGHELCTPKTSYFNGIDIFHQEYSFHPNALGQFAYSSLVKDALAK